MFEPAPVLCELVEDTEVHTKSMYAKCGEAQGHNGAGEIPLVVKGCDRTKSSGKVPDRSFDCRAWSYRWGYN